MLDVQEVTGSSPVPRTKIRKLRFPDFFFVFLSPAPCLKCDFWQQKQNIFLFFIKQGLTAADICGIISKQFEAHKLTDRQLNIAE